MPPTFKKPLDFNPELAQRTLAATQPPPSATSQKAAQSKRLLAELGLADEAYDIDDDEGFDDYDLEGNGGQTGVPVNTADLIKLQRIGEMEAYISELEAALQEKDSRILDLTKKQGYALEDADKANDRANESEELQAQLTAAMTEIKTLKNGKNGMANGDQGDLAKKVASLTAELEMLRSGAGGASSAVRKEVVALRQQLQQVSTTTGSSRRSIMAELDSIREELFGANAMTALLKAVKEQEVALSRKFNSKFADEIGSANTRAQQAEAALDSVRQQSEERIRAHQREAQAQIDHFQAKWREEFDRRRELHNQVVELKGNIRVLCRIRPLLSKEMSTENEVPPVSQLDEETVQVITEKGDKEFEFDRVFSPEEGQPEVFCEVEALVVSCLDGFNVCIMAYGQTGSGKTFTMEGPGDNPGVNTRAMAQLFDLASERGTKFDYWFATSVLEIYNEQIFDLLVPGSKDQGDKLDVKEGPDGIFVAGLKIDEVNNIDDVHNLLKVARSNRSTFATNMNEHSSRSHLVLSLYVTGQNKDTGAIMRGKLHLIDLAGSERLSRTNATGDRMKEAQAINSSLSALGDVIQALQQRNKHIPYRNSKLTRLLEDSLGGNSKCVMVVNCSPAAENANETKCSLEFASRARKVELGKAKANVGGGELPKSRSSNALGSTGNRSGGGSGATTPRGGPSTPGVKRPARPTMS